LLNNIKAKILPFYNRLIHLRRDLDDAFTYHSLERQWYGLSFWLPRSPLKAKFQIVYKRKSPTDHFLPAILSFLKHAYTGVNYLGFSRRERPRDNPALAAPKFYRGVQDTKPDVIFAYDSPLSIEEIQFLKRTDIPLASSTAGLSSFSVGGSQSKDETFEILRGYAWYFIGHRPHVAPLRDLGINAIHLPWSYEPRWFHPLETEKTYDLLFVGDLDTTLNVSRRKLITHLSSQFRTAVLSFRPPEIEQVQHLGVETNPHRLNRLLNQSKLVLGSDRASNIETLNQNPGLIMPYDDEFFIRARTYLTLGAGACYLVERHPEIQRQFEDGREIILWDDYEELGERITYLLAHDDECREIGLAGHRRALEEYSISVAMEKLLGEMGLV
jgi:hypothetical protein